MSAVRKIVSQIEGIRKLSGRRPLYVPTSEDLYRQLRREIWGRRGHVVYEEYVMLGVGEDLVEVFPV